MHLCKCGGEVELNYLGGTYFTKCQKCENIIKLKSISSGGAVMEWNDMRKKEDEEKQKKFDLLITRAQKCYSELDSIWDNYFALCPEEEEYCTHMNNLLYDFQNMIDRMNRKKKKTEIVEALLQEKALYDKVENVLYYTDVSSHPYRFNGIQEFYLSVPVEEILEEYDSLADFCTGCIPAPGASGGNDYGYARFTGFDVPEEDRDETEKEIREELSWYVDRLEQEGILSRLTVD